MIPANFVLLLQNKPFSRIPRVSITNYSNRGPELSKDNKTRPKDQFVRLSKK